MKHSERHQSADGVNPSDIRAQIERLDRLYEEVCRDILERQHPISGLLPASTAITVHGDYTDAWVRDNVYSILGVWALSMAYRRLGHFQDRAYELEQATERTMRGLLLAMMRQAEKVEAFKHNGKPTDALHAKYDTATGDAVVGDDEWGHLQFDATSLFVLMLAQMTLSGRNIISSRDEVAFVQNLVWYLSRAYLTPDYGIWERGNKINHGVRELNASSLGMVLAALEAIDGFDLFGGEGDKTTRIHVPADDIIRTELTLKAILPRESDSKEVDSALFSVIGFPAFAVRDPECVATINANIETKLAGRYGYKRFLRDGHQTALEDENKLHYEPHELEAFEQIESQWPLFLCFRLINDAIAGRTDRAIAADEQLARIAIWEEGKPLLPELYYVQEEHIEAERAQPDSTARLPNENRPLVWAQSLWVVGRLLRAGLIDGHDLDPVNRRRATIIRPRPAVSVALVAENQAVAAALTESGVEPLEVLDDSRVHIASARALADNLTHLGENHRLNLSGRPPVRILGLSTACVFMVDGQAHVVVPQLFETDDFYLTQDLSLLVHELRTSIEYLHENARGAGRPILPILISEWMLQAPDFDQLLAFIRDEVSTGLVREVPIHLDRLEAQVLTAHRITLPGFLVKWARRTHWQGDESVLTESQGISPMLAAERLDALEAQELTQRFAEAADLDEQLLLLRAMCLNGYNEQGRFADHRGRKLSLDGHLNALFRAAQGLRQWRIMRLTAEVARKVDAYLEVALMDLIVRQKQIAVGRSYTKASVIDSMRSNTEIRDHIASFCGDDPRERILTQELIIHLGAWIRAEPELFADVITLRTGPLLQILVLLHAREHQHAPAQALDELISLPPSVIREKVRDAISWREDVSKLEALHLASDVDRADLQLSPSGVCAVLPETMQTQADEKVDWHEQRLMLGAIGRLPEAFYARLWGVLAHTPGIVIGDRYHPDNLIDSARYRSESTAFERNFALNVEDVINRIGAPEYRQLSIEALACVINVIENNPDIAICEPLVVDVLIGHAVRLSWLCHADSGQQDYDEQRDQAWHYFYQSPPERAAHYLTRAFAMLIGADDNPAFQEQA